MKNQFPIRPVIIIFLAGLNISRLFPSAVCAPPIKIILSSRLKPDEPRIASEVRNICSLFSSWFGPPPDSSGALIITDNPEYSSGAGGHQIAVNSPPVPFTRLLERELAQEIARYWFAAGRFSDPLLLYGLPAYATNRYLETVYGTSNLIDLPGVSAFISGLSEHYLHRVYYYLAATNNLTFPVTEPQPDTGPFLTDAVLRAQTALLLKALEKRLGTAVMDSTIRQFRQRYLNNTGSAGLPAFLACLTAIAGPKQEVLINTLFKQDGRNDLKICRLRHQGQNLHIDLSARYPLNLPVRIKTEFTDRTVRIDTVLLNHSATISIPAVKKVRRMILDPDTSVLEPDRWNNICPRQLRTGFLFALPDFEAYQLFYGPWFWYDNYRGFQPGIWFQGRRFIDAGPVRGAHNWTLIQNYASKKSDWHTGISYQTPLLFYPVRLRLYLAGDNSFRDRGIKLYLTSEFSRPFRLPRNEIQLGYRLYELLDTTGRDPRAWNRARIAEIRSRLYRTHKTPVLAVQHELTCAQGLKPLLSQYTYTRASLVENITITPANLLPVSIRIFAGAVAGLVPLQEKFYLSGGLSYTPEEPVSWAYEGMASGQEHWHYDGDANCRGYYGLYRSGRFGWGVNIHLLPRTAWRFPLSAIQPFIDFGNVADTLQLRSLKPVFDAGIRLKLGPLYADFPFWKSAPEPGENRLAFRWSLGFKLTGLISGI
ncbi:MAG: hypothetical protein N2248_07050 [candidate division WOR-3 bacterium]|uniref:Uncharacterized protein n=2 Tax=candidate division WOR-3 bacterium TaxID=2052148 RepID=A0A7C1SBZ9_UNCW3|nr:hypothetical protein [candidate division WOR-3 bacterium]